MIRVVTAALTAKSGRCRVFFIAGIVIGPSAAISVTADPDGATRKRSPHSSEPLAPVVCQAGRSNPISTEAGSRPRRRGCGPPRAGCASGPSCLSRTRPDRRTPAEGPAAPPRSASRSAPSQPSTAISVPRASGMHAFDRRERDRRVAAPRPLTPGRLSGVEVRSGSQIKSAKPVRSEGSGQHFVTAWRGRRPERGLGGDLVRAGAAHGPDGGLIVCARPVRGQLGCAQARRGQRMRRDGAAFRDLDAVGAVIGRLDALRPVGHGGFRAADTSGPRPSGRPCRRSLRSCSNSPALR
jgi:hypothetical protein